MGDRPQADELRAAVESEAVTQWWSIPGDLVHVALALSTHTRVFLDVCLGMADPALGEPLCNREFIMRRARKSITLHPGWIAGPRDPSTATLLWRAEE